LAHRDKFGRLKFGRKWEKRDDSASPPRQLPITLPLKIHRLGESFAVVDAAGRAVSYVAYEIDAAKRQQTKRFSENEARELAQLIARLLTDVDERAAGPNPATIPLEDLNAENDE
jgi:hypothetical protein